MLVEMSHNGIYVKWSQHQDTIATDAPLMQGIYKDLVLTSYALAIF